MTRAVLLSLALLSAFGYSDAGSVAQTESKVLVTRVDGPITPVIADHLRSALDRAESAGYATLVVRLDTPGGLDTSMRKIIQRFLASPVPVVVHVSPKGARAASAGALITFAAHVAAMSPGTAIGASTPVDMEGGDVERKVVNDAAAFAESVARVRGRNVEFAVDTVREGRSAPADEALALGAVDVVAGSMADLLSQIDGMRVDVEDRAVTLRTAGATVDTFDMGFLRRVQQRLADPNLAFLFLSIGTLGIIYELASPGFGIGGVVGAVLILLALFGVSVLPVNAVGVILLLLAAALFVAELFAPGVGIAAAGGAVLLVLSGVFLFDDAPGLEVSLAVIGPIAAVTGGAVVFAGRLVLSSRGAPSTTTGSGRLVGREATVRRAEGRTGQVFMEGAWWRVRSTDQELEAGAVVRVVDIEGLELIVEPTGTALQGPTQTGGHHE